MPLQDRRPTRLVALVRHPAAEIAQGLCYGSLDVPLSDAGRAAVAAIRDRCSALKATRLFSSPSRRCQDVARALERPGLVTETDARLRELAFGAWEGQRWDAVPRAALDVWAADPRGFAPPGGESGAALIARVTAFRDRIEDTQGNVIVVSHGGPLRLLGAVLTGAAPDLLAPTPTLGSVTIVTLPA